MISHIWSKSHLFHKVWGCSVGCTGCSGTAGDNYHCTNIIAQISLHKYHYTNIIAQISLHKCHCTGCSGTAEGKYHCWCIQKCHPFQDCQFVFPIQFFQESYWNHLRVLINRFMTPCIDEHSYVELTSRITLKVLMIDCDDYDDDVDHPHMLNSRPGSLWEFL